jgi:hypothetical protein
MAILREDWQLQVTHDRRFPGKTPASFTCIDDGPTIFIRDFAQKPWEFSGFSHILTDTS